MSLVPPEATRPPKGAHVLDEARLLAWLREGVAGLAPRDVVVTQFRGGQSNPTYWLGVTGEDGAETELVLRKKPPGKILPSAHAIEREYRVMRALAGTDVPVPETLALCEDPAVIGTPFFLMRKVEGTVHWDPTVPELPSNGARRALYEEYVRVLAAIHSVDVTARGLADFGRVGGYVPRQVERWSLQYEASRTEHIPAMEALMEWLRTHAPETDETSLVHGDYRIDNLVFAGTPDEPVAVATLDWELSTLGHPLSDLAYACLGYHMNIPGRGGLAGVDLAAIGIPSQDELVALYAARTGRTTIPSFSTFLAFGIFRLAAIAQGVYKRSLQGNASSEDAGRYGAAVGMLAEIACGLVGVAVRR